MKRASYRNGIDFIALKNEPGDKDLESIEGYTTVFLMSELFGVSKKKIAKDVLQIRLKNPS